MRRFHLLLPLLLATAALLHCTSAQERSDELQDGMRVAVFTGSADGRKGLKVIFPGEIAASDTNVATVQFKILNLLEEQVFVDVTGFDDLNYTLEHNGNLIGRGGSLLFPDNTNLLKRLHAASYKNGKCRLCGCAIAHITGKFRCDDFTSWIGAKGTVSLTISGYKRSNGAFFSQDLVVPITIVK